MSRKKGMSLNKKWGIEIALFVLIAGGCGYWVYMLIESRDKLTQELTASLEPKLKTSRDKIRRIPIEESRRSTLNVRRNELAVAVPVLGDQEAPDLMRVLDALKRNVETSKEAHEFPLVVFRSGNITPPKLEVASKSKKKKSKRGKSTSSSPVMPVQISIQVSSTFVGLLRFVDLVEKDRQLMKVTGLSTDLNEASPGMGDEASRRSPLASPLSDLRYVNSVVTIEGWYLRPDKKKGSK